MEPGSTAYNSPQVYVLEGDFDPAQLEQAVCRMIVRHEVLRTSFVMVSGQPVQRAADELGFKIDCYDLEPGELEQGEVIQDFLRPFDLSTAPCFRLAAARLSGGQHLLLFDIHHIITDGVTHEIFSRELMLLYAGEALAPLRIHYKDYSEWQNRADQQALLAQQEAFWLSQFQSSAEIPVLVLPYDYVRPKVQSFEGAVQGFGLSAEESRALADVASAEGVTLYMVLLAIFKLLLFKLSSQEDMVVGTPVAGRRHAELAGVIGFFVNTLPIRSYPAPEKTVRSFLHEVRETALQAFDNQGYQFEDLVEKAAVHRDTGRNPLFDVLFVLQTGQGQTGLAKIELPHLKLTTRGYKINTSKFDLTLQVVEADGRLSASIEYCSRLFKAETIDRFIGYFRAIIHEAIRDPDVKIADIEIIPEAERRQVLHAFNNTRSKYPQYQTICEIFADRAEEIPDRTAICFRDRYVTYKALKTRVQGLAGTLRQKGVKNGVLVGVLLNRSLAMVEGIFGILRAGGAYLPLDAGSPQARIRHIVSDSGIELLLGRGDFAGGYAFGCDGIDPEEKFNRSATGEIKGVEVGSAGDLMYVLYTSGSTGMPKGTMVNHSSVVNVLFNLEKLYPIGGDGVYLFKTNFTFDVSVTEIFGWFMGGGRSVILEAGKEKDPAALIDTILNHKVTHINFVPSMWSMFLDFVDGKLEDRLKGLRYVLVAGEAFSRTLAVKGGELPIPVKIENIYGPTEGAIYTTNYSLSEFGDSGSVPIGKVLDNMKVYIVDKGENLLPIGVPGELCIGGTGVARGYLNRPELTSEKFIESPFERGERLYLTGDLAKWLPDGNIEFLGRIDQQVKIRGFRIELGEIENHLLKYEAINDAIVVALESETGPGAGEKYLCAYFVSEQDLSTNEIREYLAEKLPDYMIPSYFMRLEKMPLTPSGKVNRQALLSAEALPAQSEVSYAPPQNETERRIAAAWKEVLRRERVGRNDNFFDLGGNSLNAIHIIGRLNEDFETEISVITMFEYPTVGAFCRYLIQERVTGDLPLRKQSEQLVTEMRDLPPDAIDAAKERREIQLSIRSRIDADG
jgi:tyrocidine synthetase-3